MPGATFLRKERLRSGGEFRRVFRRGVRLDGRLFLLLAVPNGLEHARLGMAASRKVGGAVLRNRAKRLLREAFRRHKPEVKTPADIVLVVKREIVECGQAEVDRELTSRFARLARTPSRSRRPDPDRRG